MLPLCCPVVIVVQTKAVEFVCFLERGKSVSDEDKPRAHRISADLRRILAHHDEPVDYEPLSELMGEYEVGLRVVGCELPFIVRDELLYRCRRVESTAAVRTHDERQSVCFVRTQQAAYLCKLSNRANYRVLSVHRRSLRSCFLVEASHQSQIGLDR